MAKRTKIVSRYLEIMDFRELWCSTLVDKTDIFLKKMKLCSAFKGWTTFSELGFKFCPMKLKPFFPLLLSNPSLARTHKNFGYLKYLHSLSLPYLSLFFPLYCEERFMRDKRHLYKQIEHL